MVVFGTPIFRELVVLLTQFASVFIIGSFSIASGRLEVQLYTEVSTQSDMDQLLGSIAGFHDSMTKEVHLINRGAVLANHSMDMSHRLDAQVLIQSQWPPFALELLFTNIKTFELKSAREYWDASGVVEERLKPVAERIITMRFDRYLKIVAERLHIRTRDNWLGHLPFFGTEVPTPDAVPARVLQGQWRQCSICADAWEAESREDFSRCPNCGAITQLEP